MTTQDIGIRQFFDGNGSTTTFDFTFEYGSDSEVKAYVSGVAVTISSIAASGSGAGGTVTLASAPATGTSNVLITREVPYTQTTEIPTVDKLGRGTLENAFDKQTRLIQQLRDEVDRSFKVASTQDIDADTSITLVAGKALIINDDGDGITTSTDDYEDQAADAAASASAASASATTASTAATNAATSATAAATSATAAATSATAAATSETNLLNAIGTTVQAYDADLTVIAGLADPNADRILFWDDSAGAYTFLAPSTGLSISGTSLSASAASDSAAGIIELATTAETATGSATDRAVTPAGLAGWTNALTAEATLDTSNDYLALWDNSASAMKKVTLGNIRGSGSVTKYTSSAQTVTAAATTALAHGLGASPKIVQIWLKCTTTDAGWAVNDEITWEGYDLNYGTTRNFIVYRDATNVTVLVGSGGIVGANKSTGAFAALTASSWNFIVEAWV